MASEEEDSEEYLPVEDSLHLHMVQYRSDFKEDISKKRYPGTRPATAARLKRVVSCKRKTHHLVVTRRKPGAGPGAGPGRAGDTAVRQDQSDPEEEMIFHMDPWEPQHSVQPDIPGEDSFTHTHYCTEISKHHRAMIEVLFSRNLRLTIAMTLWRRNVGEFLTYLMRIQDMAVFVDCLPVITASIKEDSTLFSIGCCVDLLPLVRTALSSPYEGYLMAALSWVESVLNTRWKDLTACGTCSQSSDRNMLVFKQQILDVWSQEACWSLAPGRAGAVAAVIHTYLSHLSHLP